MLSANQAIITKDLAGNYMVSFNVSEQSLTNGSHLQAMQTVPDTLNPELDYHMYTGILGNRQVMNFSHTAMSKNYIYKVIGFLRKNVTTIVFLCDYNGKTVLSGGTEKINYLHSVNVEMRLGKRGGMKSNKIVIIAKVGVTMAIILFIYHLRSLNFIKAQINADNEKTQIGSTKEAGVEMQPEQDELLDSDHFHYEDLKFVDMNGFEIIKGAYEQIDFGDERK